MGWISRRANSFADTTIGGGMIVFLMWVIDIQPSWQYAVGLIALGSVATFVSVACAPDN